MSQQCLFTYGTLQVSEIFEHIVGRALASCPARLEGYARYRVDQRVYPAIVRQSGAQVAGLLYSGLDARELEHLDVYEGELYERTRLVVQAGGALIEAWTYVLGDAHLDQLATDPWDLETFQREHLASYLTRVSVTRRAP
jgi:gamma-glutamylcyclotransferase (GGCT)/AIG2-like uncharacterized protein YtfP